MKNGEYIENETLAPKSLNRIVCALKAYLLFKNLINNTTEFKQFKFDKTSRVTRDKALITNDQFKRMFDASNTREKVVISFYGIHGVRPSLIPQLVLEDLKSPKDMYTPLYANRIPDKIKLEEFQWIMVKKEYEGNKGNIDFPIVLNGELAEWLSQHLNRRRRRGECLTLKSQLVDIPSKKAVDDVVDKLFTAVGFEGRNYLLRHYANKRLKAAYEDKDFKEWCMGHKGDISAIYDHEHGLSKEEIEEYNKNIDMSKLRIYGATASELKNCKLMVSVAQKLSHADTKQLDEILKLLEKGKMTFEQFDERLTIIVREAQRKAVIEQFDELMKEYNKRNNQAVE